LSKFSKFTPKADLNSSFVVFLVSMPLCLGIAVASGAPTISGIIGGVIGGVIVSFFGGSPLLVTGPANGLLVISWEFIQHNGFSLFLWSILLAGLLQVLAGVLKLGQFFRAVTPGVILGLMSGFAIVIFSGQLLVVLGQESAGTVFSNFTLAFSAIMEFANSGVSQTVQVGCGTLLLLFGYDKFVPKKWKVIPAALVALILATAVTSLLGMDVTRIDLPKKIFSSITYLDLSLWDTLLDPLVIKTALLIAFIASAETLLCATAVDKLHTGERTHYNKELTAQGIGNTLCGLFGGIPVTGVIIRSTTNVMAGAKSKWSTIFSGIWLLTFVALFPGLLSEIPQAVLAAVLIHSVTKLIRVDDVKHLWEYDRFAIVVFATTTIGLVFFGVLTGVAAGLVLSTLHSLQSMSRTVVTVEENGDRTNLVLAGSATFFRIPQIATALEDIDSETNVVIDHKDLLMIDFSVYTMLQEWEDQHNAMGGTVSPSIADMIEHLPYVAMRSKTT
jgi:MFS superfamily sulfate permease-like transporter